MRLTTDRLVLREMTDDDLPALGAILQDETTMAAYNGPFTDEEVTRWLRRQQRGYREDGHGLWAVELTTDPTLIGQCGITRQTVDGTDVLEVGYLFSRAHWHRGYATEAARAARDWAFATLAADAVYALVRDTNIASMNVAIRLGMTVRGRFVKHYRGCAMPHYAFAVTRPPVGAAGASSRRDAPAGGVTTGGPGHATPGALWFDDLAVGQHFQSVEPIRLTSTDIIDFARRFDPKPGHLDPAAAEETFFAGLAASGWQTAAVTHRLVGEAGFPLAHSVGLGTELRWVTPARPGDDLTVDVEVVSARPSRSQPDRGVVELVSRTVNQDGDLRQEARTTILMWRDPAVVAGIAPPEAPSLGEGAAPSAT